MRKFQEILREYTRYNQREVGPLIESRAKRLRFELYRQFKAIAPSKERIEQEATSWIQDRWLYAPPRHRPAGRGDDPYSAPPRGDDQPVGRPDVDPSSGKDLGGKHEIYRAKVGPSDDITTIRWQPVTTNSPVRNIRPMIQPRANSRKRLAAR